MVARLKFAVRAVAKGLVGGDFASTEIHRFIFSGRICHRQERATLMRPIAKWLAFAFSARTPVIGFASFNVHCIGGFLGDFRFHFHFHDGRLLFNGFNWNINCHVITDIGNVLTHIEIAAFNHCAGIHAAGLFFGHRMRHA
jgi:hypothetical protein